MGLLSEVVGLVAFEVESGYVLELESGEVRWGGVGLGGGGQGNDMEGRGALGIRVGEGGDGYMGRVVWRDWVMDI